MRLAFLVGFALSVACGKPATPTPPAGAPQGEVWLSDQQIAQGQIRIAPVEIRPLADKLITGGKIAFDDLSVARVFSPVAGRVTQIFADFGQEVKAGDPLCAIDSPDLASAYSDLLKATADLTAAEHDVKRQRELRDAHAAAESLYEQSEDNYRKAQAEMERARLKTKLLHARDANVVTQKFVLRAPIGGEIVGRNVNPGIEVQGMLSGASVSNELFTVGSLDRVWVLADVYEAQVGKVKAGDKVEIATVAYGESFHGTVDYVGDVLDPTTRTARVRCSVDNPGHKLKPEMFVTVSVGLGQRQALAVPRTAVLKLSDQSVVFVEIGRTESGLRRFASRPVKTGDDEGGFIEILSGLQPGDQLVTEAGAMSCPGIGQPVASHDAGRRSAR